MRTYSRNPNVLVSGLLLAFLLAAPASGAETIVADGTTCTLADAILSANAATAVGGCASGSSGNDLVILDYDVTLTSPDTIHSTKQRGAYAGLPTVKSELTLRAGAGSLIERAVVTGCDSDSTPFRLITVNSSGHLTLEGLTLRGGCAASTNSNSEGGAVLVKSGGKLWIDDCTFTDNQVRAATGYYARGGAISVYKSTLVSAVDSVFARNLAIAADRSNGTVTEAYGGAVSIHDGTLGTVTTCEFIDNEVRGGSVATSGGAGKAFGGGIAVDNGPVDTIERTLFRGNLAQGGSTPSGNGGHARGAGFYTTDSAVDTISDSYFYANQSLGGDGSKGGQGSGGGVHVSGSGSLDVMTRNTLSRNLVRSGAGTSSSIQSKGGGAYLVVVANTVSNNTFDANTSWGGAHTGGGTGGDGTGGGLRTTKAIHALEHNTFIRNEVFGGTGSVDGLSLGRDVQGDGNPITASNNIFWAGQPEDQDVVVLSAACQSANWISEGYNSVDDAGNCTFAAQGDMFGLDPDLSFYSADTCSRPLRDGSCPPTAHPVSGSPMIDQGSCAVSGASQDAMGDGRPYDDADTSDAADGCDIGAIEYQGGGSMEPGTCQDCDVVDPGLIPTIHLF